MPKSVIELVDELKLLLTAHSLLERVYLEYGPYGNGKISQGTLDLMNSYFEFDDSE